MQSHAGPSGHSPQPCLWEPGSKTVAEGSHSRHLLEDTLATTLDTRQVPALRLAKLELPLRNFLQSYPPLPLSPYFKTPPYFLSAFEGFVFVWFFLTQSTSGRL